ncbi:MAG: hypothetical protein NNA18_10300 [Nitrospira sp.]|nr:hypothetical protein [Nitrospira sp.]
MRKRSPSSRSFLAAMIAVLLLVFSFNAYACVLPLAGTTDASMANGCSTPMEQPARPLCDAFKTLGVESSPQLSFLHMDHHWSAADQMPAALPVVSCRLAKISSPYHSLESSSPPHQSLASTVLRI